MSKYKPVFGQKCCRNGQKAVLLIGFLFLQSAAFAQNARYFIEFIDKRNSPYSVDRPLEFLSQRSVNRRVQQRIAVMKKDLPVNPAYLQAVRSAGARVWYTSRWMNGALIEADPAALGRVRQLPFVRTQSVEEKVTEMLQTGPSHTGTQQVEKSAEGHQIFQTTNPPAYGAASPQLNMLEVNTMHSLDYTGKNIHIAVLDGGFRNADQLPFFRHLISENRILGTYDFVNKEKSVFEDEAHGMQVLSAIGAFQPGELVGPAYGSAFWLLRTEDSSGEYRVEEVNWLIAAEFADSVGVDILHSSLGYNLFDDHSMDYNQRQMDGETALVTKAADMAAATGMLVVVSAGNEGDDPWRTISAPADADSVLAVGAVDARGFRVPFSSIGPSADGRVKPDIAAMGQGTVVGEPDGSIGTSSGTSFAAPLVTGLAAGLWQAFPQLTNMEVISYLKRSGSQSTRPDSLLGYGIPNFSKALELANRDYGKDQPMGYLSPNPLRGETFTLWLNARMQKVPVTVQLFDMTGRAVAEKYLSNPARQNNLDFTTASLRQGLYLVRLISAGQSTTLKLIKW